MPGLTLLTMLGASACSCSGPMESSEPTETGDSGDSGDSGDTGPDWCAGGEPTVTLGTGTAEYVPMEDGDELEMTYGPQGGWHFYTGVKLDNLTSIVELTVEGYCEETGELICWGYYRVLSVCVDECDCTYWDMYCYISVDELESNPDGLEPWELKADKDVRLTVTVVDQDGREVYDELMVVAVPDPSNVGGKGGT